MSRANEAACITELNGGEFSVCNLSIMDTAVQCVHPDDQVPRTYTIVNKKHVGCNNSFIKFYREEGSHCFPKQYSEGFPL